MICIEVIRKHSKPFLVGTWYRSPNSDIELFLFKCDTEDKELILLGDLNCDFSKTPQDYCTRKLLALCSLYQLTQVINEHTRVTETTSSLIDVILTNTHENILTSGVLHIGISDHSLVYTVRKFKLSKFRPTVKDAWNFKHFSDSFLSYEDPKTCWFVWKSIFLEIPNRHALLRHRRTKVNPVPWIMPTIKQLREWDYLKKGL